MREELRPAWRHCKIDRISRRCRLWAQRNDLRAAPRLFSDPASDGCDTTSGD